MNQVGEEEGACRSHRLPHHLCVNRQNRHRRCGQSESSGPGRRSRSVGRKIEELVHLDRAGDVLEALVPG